jgi:hypothetical protein
MGKAILLSVVFFLALLSLADAQVRVRPHIRKDGTYVPGHLRSQPDGNPYNNWGYPGNINPYTGEEGRGDPYRYLDRYRDKGGSLDFGLDKYDLLNPYRR